MTLCKNCGKGIKWFKDSVNDKWIPLEVIPMEIATHQNHTCNGREQEDVDFAI
jgi:hypothetical protein